MHAESPDALTPAAARGPSIRRHPAPPEGIDLEFETITEAIEAGRPLPRSSTWWWIAPMRCCGAQETLVLLREGDLLIGAAQRAD